MARGTPTPRTLIGYTLYGDYENKRLKQHTSLTAEDKALEHGKRIGLTNVKAYPIYKDEN